MSEVTSYKTQPGDRWDLVAFKAYGDPYKVNPIIRANPSLPLYDVLPPGIDINVPVVDRPRLNMELLPPWKR